MACCTPPPPKMLDELCSFHNQLHKIFLSSLGDNFSKRDKKIITLLVKQFDIVCITQEGFYDFEETNPRIIPKPYRIEYKHPHSNDPNTRFYWEFQPKY